jgi:undecaprenyl-diphosphatase
MITLLQTIILAIVQGIAEWFPISSSGHLVIFQHLLGIEQPVFYDVVLHIGSLIVILIVFYRDIINLITGVVTGKKESLNLLLFLIIATIPIAIVGYFLKSQIENIFNNLLMVGFALLFTSLLLFMSKYPRFKHKELNLKNSFIIGLFQAIALLPGVSRSGSTISSGLFQGVKPKEAARFSFLLFIPAVIGATILEVGHLSEITNLSYVFIGLIITIFIGTITLSFLLSLIERNKFSGFAWYCLIVGILVLIWAILL